MNEYLKPIEVSGIKFWSKDNNDFFDMTFNVQFSSSKIILSNPALNFSTEIALTNDRAKPVSIDKKDETTTILAFANLKFMMSNIQAIRVEKFLKNLNKQIEEQIESSCNKINETCNSLKNEVYTIASNVLQLSDVKVMLNHDAVIIFQKMISFNKYDTYELYDRDILENENFFNYISPFYEVLNSFADLLEEEYNVDSDLKQNVAWELVKRVSIKFYSDIWEKSYGQFLEPLKKNIDANAKSDGTLDRYIMSIINCNEIEYSEEILAYFTYYIMEQGYAIGKQYFPAYFDICKKAFEAIGDNLHKYALKNKLRGKIEKKEIHYSIDDVDLMNGNEFEYFICDLFTQMGYSAEVTKQSGDQGLDVIAEKKGRRIGVQAKCYSNSVGNLSIQEAFAGKSFYNCDKVIVVTNNFFTNSAIELAQVNNVILWDRNILKEKIFEIF